jgi:hypothetical protein
MQLQPQSKALTYPHGSAFRLTPAGQTLLSRRIRLLCARRTPGPEITKILNRELGLDRNLDYYWKRAKQLDLEWTAAERIGRPGHRVTPVELLPADERHCKFCGKDRLPALYVLNKLPPMLCDNHCCPECGVKLEVHEVPKKAADEVEARYWAHPFPMPPRKCLNPKCGVEFVPKDRRKPHQEGCSRPCTQIISTRRWEMDHPAEAKELQQRSSQNRQEKVEQARILDQLSNKPVAWRRIVPLFLINRDLSNAQAQDLAGIKPSERLSRSAMNRVRIFAGVRGPQGRPAQKL